MDKKLLKEALEHLQKALELLEQTNDWFYLRRMKPRLLSVIQSLISKTKRN
jgi:uncharacterized protein YutE (UPF0331/DUF86 family)